ncbi:MAG: hypothetical protein IIA85_02620 [Nanoarchaeota archaeon]|nr:hypothetical protein [Nanoarchaeota archaeon]
MHEKEHVMNILEETKKATAEENVIRLKELSNQTIHSASTSQDTDSILIAIIIYSLSKIIERKVQYGEKNCDDFCASVSKKLSNAIIALKKGNEDLFHTGLQTIINSINKLSTSFKQDIQNIFHKARINKASKIYEHGISMGKTAELLGISQYELAIYAGQKGIDDPEVRTSPVKDRIKLAMSFFK